MMPSIERYVTRGIKPGDFLTAVIQNDLAWALGKADEENLRNLPAYGAYFYNEVPSRCWGSPKKMSEWMEAHCPIAEPQEERDEPAI